MASNRSIIKMLPIDQLRAMLIISANKIKDFEKMPNKRPGLLLLHAELLSEIEFRENKTKYE